HPALTPCLHSNRLRREHIWMPASCNNSRQVQRRSPSLRPVNLLLLLLLSLLVGVPSLDAQTTGTIEGHVLDVRTSQPISGVRASIALGANYSQINRMVTDITGAFRFDGIPPGEYPVRVEAEEFRYSGVLPAVKVAAGETVKDVRILMQAMASVSGRVFDENDEPLANATIEVLSPQE